MQISRRNFLGITGASLLSAGILPGNLREAWSSLVEPVVGRVLRPTPVIAQGEVVRHLWPDSTVPLYGGDAGVFYVPGGTIDRHAVQPMVAFHADEAISAESRPGLVAVVAPVAAVRAWAAIDAPLVTRVGYGGVLVAVDALPDSAGQWYGVSEASAPAEILGWTPANRWTVVPGKTEPVPGEPRLVLDRTRFTVTFHSSGQAVARFPAAVGPDAIAGEYAVTEKSVGGMVAEQHGAGWQLHWPGGVLYGAHWHHDQGGPGHAPGWGVAPWVAQWLYQRVGPGTSVVIR